MPSRIISASICESESLSKLPWFEQMLFIRLIVSVDDFGRFDGRPAVIKGRLFPLDDVTVKKVEDGLALLSRNEMVSRYTVAGKPYISLCAWSRYNTTRANKSKYPGPEEDTSYCERLQSPASICKQMQTDSSVFGIRNSNFDIRNSDSVCGESTQAEEAGENSGPSAEETQFGQELHTAFLDWLAYKQEKKQKYQSVGLRNLIAEIRNNARKYSESEVAAVIRVSIANQYQGIVFDKLTQSRGVGYTAREKPPQGCGELGAAELEAIQRTLRESSLDNGAPDAEGL